MPEAPSISLGEVSLYKNRKGNDSMIVLTINYKDANGDIGLSPSDTFPPFQFGGEGFYNLLVTYLVRNGSNWEKIVRTGTQDTIHYNQRFPRLNPSDKNRGVSGSMDLRIPAIPYPGIKPAAVRFRIQMLDRRLQRSQEIASGDINLKH